VSRLPPALARRVDRLARRAHAFHRWSHHPLCGHYRAEVIPLGRRARLCLGCSLTAAGTVVGLAAGFSLPAAQEAALLAACAALLALVPLVVRGVDAATAGAHASPGPGPGLPGKLLKRFLPTALPGFAVAQALRAPSPARLGAAALAAAAVGWVVLRYQRRGPDRSACRACPEGPPGTRCPGFAPIARRERALARLAGRWIAASLPPPQPPHGTGATPLPPPAWPQAPPSTAPSPSTPRPS
jgi:hypothetical protein